MLALAINMYYAASSCTHGNTMGNTMHTRTSFSNGLKAVGLRVSADPDTLFLMFWWGGVVAFLADFFGIGVSV